MLNQDIYHSITQNTFKYLFFITIFFSATWLISCIAAVKLILVFGLTFTGGFIIFPFTSLISSLIVEVYGYKNVRQAIWSGFLLNVLFVFFIFVVNLLPASPSWPLGDAFNQILMPSLRITGASLVSFIISFFLNAYIMAKMKIRSNGKRLQERILISNLVSLTIDIFLFIFLAFYGTLPFTLLIKLLFAAYVKKIICELAFLPFMGYLIDTIKAKEGIEILDFDTNFAPFSMDNIYPIDSYRRTA